ncbi:MAG TPA: NUDIX domain-containing protein [Phycisphaerales bacterium]|nr:NUDIX domain-containing protein [Phycisphaerales bacterium]
MPPYVHKIAVLCELRDDQGRYLLIRRAKDPNRGLCSPIGGKLDTTIGESPIRCAQREIEEEAGITLPLDRLRLVGIVSEHGYDNTTNWLMFWYRVTGPVVVPEHTINEGELIWRSWDDFKSLALPETDEKVIWPLVRAHENEGSLFSVHIDCTDCTLKWTVLESRHATP